MAKVLPFSGVTTLPVPVERVLDGATQCETVLVLGWEPDGTLYAASSVADKRAALWLVETFKHKLLSGDYDG